MKFTIALGVTIGHFSNLHLQILTCSISHSAVQQAQLLMQLQQQRPKKRGRPPKNPAPLLPAPGSSVLPVALLDSMTASPMQKSRQPEAALRAAAMQEPIRAAAVAALAPPPHPSKSTQVWSSSPGQSQVQQAPDQGATSAPAAAAVGDNHIVSGVLPPPPTTTTFQMADVLRSHMPFLADLLSNPNMDHQALLRCERGQVGEAKLIECGY